MENSTKKYHYFRFDRHELFTVADMELVLDLMEEVRYKNDGYENMTFGLYDGYLYLDLIRYVGKNIPEESRIGTGLSKLFHRIMTVGNIVIDEPETSKK